MYRTKTCGELNIANVNETVELSGWIQKIRDLGAMIFIDLRDQFGITQIVINDEEVQKQATENTKGVGNKNWVMRDIANTLIAIPPLQEQYRIVEEFKKYNIFLLEYDKKENETLFKVGDRIKIIGIIKGNQKIAAFDQNKETYEYVIYPRMYIHEILENEK